ncbi:MAG: 30S ribosomal protein S21 [Thomasclavelia spiroformis]
MSEIKVGENETLESALRRFKRKCARAGFFQKLERENII